ncbi:MAG: S8 family serine peptidase, partial [Phycisphaerales bacterium]
MERATTWIEQAHEAQANAARFLSLPLALLGAGLMSAAVVAQPTEDDSADLRGLQTRPVLQANPAPQAVPGRLIIKYATTGTGPNKRLPRTLPDATRQVLDRLAGGAVLNRRPLLRSPAMARQTQPLRRFWEDRMIMRQKRGLTDIEVVTVPAATNVAALCRELVAVPEIEWAHPDYLFTYDMEPNDPYYHSAGSWGQAYDDLYGPKLLDCAAAWDITQGEGTVVAIVDSGVDYNHPDLAANMWVNLPEDINGNGQFDNWPADEIRDGVAGDLDGLDNDGNGYADDVVGYDFVGDGLIPDPDPVDPLGHGTHVAGTVAAVGNNALGIIGVAPQARIMALKVGGDAGSGVSVSAAAEAVVYLADNGARVSNSSWGGFLDTPELRAAFEYAADADVISVVSAGNANAYAEFYIPASYETTITVAATDHEDYKAPFSNFGMAVDIAAPGGGESEPADVNRPDYSILSLLAAESAFASWPYVIGNNYMRLAGTSMAAPHVAGVAALVRSAYPGAIRQEVRGRLKAGAESIDQLNPGFEGLLGSGRVNAVLSLTAAPQPYLEVTGVRVLGPAVPDRSFELVVTLRNEWTDAHNTQLALSCATPGVTVTQPQAVVGNIPGGQEADNSAEPLGIHLDSTIPWGQHLLFEMSCQYDEGSTAFEFPVAVQIFQNVIAETGLPTSGASSISLRMQDLNGDDYPDVLVPYALDMLRFFLNQTDGSFAEVPLPLAVHSVYGIGMADLDDDGLRDIIAPGNVYGGPIYTHIYRQLANLQLMIAPYDEGLTGPVGSCTLILDADGDGLLDLVRPGIDRALLLNNGGF